MMKLNGLGSVLAVALLSACAQLTPPPKKAAPVRINQDPYPSTYHRYPGALTVIRRLIEVSATVEALREWQPEAI